MLWFVFLLASLCGAIDNGLGITPPMGWRSWNCYHGAVRDQQIRDTVDAVVSRSRTVGGKPMSLLDVGYTNVGVDDGWQACGTGPYDSFHDASGHPLVNTSRFPSLRGLTSYGHQRGVKMGWYQNNCICHESARLIHNETWINLTYVGDVQQLLEGQFDGVKLDSCGLHSDLTYYATLMNRTGRPYLIENCHQGHVVPNHTWCPFNLYRTSGDIRPSWGSILHNLLTTVPYQDESKPLSRPGCWAYPDMLEVGNFVGDLAYVESRTHFGAWCVVSSPLILGLDLTDSTRLDAVWDIITNREAIAVNQRWEGHPGRRVNTTGLPSGCQVWAKRQAPKGSQAVLVINTNSNKMGAFSIPLAALNAPDPSHVRDIWNQRDEPHTSTKALVVPALGQHDSAFVLLTPA